MGQEVHRKGLILNSSLDGSRVDVEITGGAFSMSMLEMHLQMNYDGARIVSRSLEMNGGDIHASIQFDKPEDAVRFHLSH